MSDPIITAAADVLDRTGTLTMDAVARAAGVSRATVYRRTGGRARLLARLAEARGVTVDALGADPRVRALDAIEALIAGGGLGAVTLERVAERAGTSVATLYRHFGDRAGLIAAFGAERTPRRLSPMLDASPGEDIAADLRRLARDVVDFGLEYPATVRLMLDPATRGRAPIGVMPGGPRRLGAALTDYFARQIAAGRLRGAPDRMAMAFGVLLLGLLMADAEGVRRDPDATADFVADTLLNGWAAE